MSVERTDWDAIVIGGGPAGSTAARYAAQGGASVLVIDGRDPIGSPLQCGELVPSNDEMRRLCPDVPDIEDLLRTPEHVISLRTNQMHLVPPSGKPLRYSFEGLVLNRVAHDEELVELARSRGVEYLVGTRVAEINSSTVILADGSQYNAQVIIGAGGHNDPLRKSHWDVDSLNIPVKFVLVDGKFDDALELHFGSVAPGGYAWVFPKQGGANIGLGIQRNLAKGRSLNLYSEEFFSRYQGEVIFSGAGSLPMSGTIPKFVKGNHLLVGDAAGMVLPSNGAGITIAMIGGRIAGQVVAEHLRDDTPLEEYETRWNKQMGKVMRNSKFAFKLGTLMFRSPDWLLNLMFNRLTKPFIWRAVTCRSLFSLR
ncbi:MAG TPA: NAD(P)/FAD-dependent oxidoreductase [Candidatus Poseidoniales archaeon]|jgi:digeranylgeranylglycerophospholipid reductase|nr:MAG TPA: NAD(P)/FAD-dependent oxidoreductase [Candidatus Poseidoniales archaeon]HIH56539.1 NAD(P)/FAD-dependent oxidoreductase [Candidatus Thalassarchaeum sp.]|tara:strand:+ start:499 stop:1602 length:1104 start_codon:yes stop_codon:yes gene_type:complete